VASASRAETSSIALDVNYTNVSNKPTLISASSQVSYTGLNDIPAGIVSSSTQVTALLPNGTVSSSGQVSYTGLSNIPIGIVSASSQVSYIGLSNIPAGILSSSTQINNLSGVSASFATSASRAQTASLALAVDYINVSNKPTLISASSQVSYTGLGNIPAGIVSSSNQVTTLLPNGTVSSSGQVSYTGLSNIPVGIVSASSQVSYTGLSNISAGILSSSTQINNLSGVSASFAQTASFLLGSVTSASFATSASRAQTASLALAVDYANVNNKPTLISASSQVSYTGLSGIPSGIVSSSTQVTALLPNGTVSSSGQVSYTGLSNIPSGILSSSTQINNLSGVSASFAQTASFLLGSVASASFATTAATASSFSGSLQVVGRAEFGEGLIVSGGLAVNGGITGSLLGTSSFATTASFALNAGGSGFPFSGSAIITGSLLVSGSGLNVTGSANVLGNFTATTKSFKIPHQTRAGKSLIYGVLEGKEHAVYARGVIKHDSVIILPEEWSWLVDMDSITVQLTPIGKYQTLYVKSIDCPHIIIENDTDDIHCHYLVHATRKDVAPLITVE
jgi:hypothetical protein